MARMTMEEILKRVGELKKEIDVKNEVIREQQQQIHERDDRIAQLDKHIESLSSDAGQADDLLDQISQALE